MSDSNNSIEQGGTDNTQTNNIDNSTHYHTSNRTHFSKILNSGVEFDHNIVGEIVTLIYNNISSNENNENNDFSSIDIDEKNQINNHSVDYFQNVVESDFYPQFSQLEKFIQLRENKKLQQRMALVTTDLNRKILAFQEDNQGTKFEKVLLNISDSVIDNNYKEMQDKQEQVLLLLYYFYTTCSIGKKK